MIIILPESLINKIAAGEIIERPASVIRELIDNSIDANASRIDIEVIHGGKKLIKVSDNGIGMSRDDAILSIERHATSKLKREDDLFNISTLGFRGEALPAIASVSKLTIVTSTVNDHTGTRVEVSMGGKRISDAPPLKGTIVEVRDIFYNTPARRKFLKGISTELSHIIDIVTQRAIAYHEISFSLTHNNNVIMNVPSANNLKDRFLQLYGDDFVGEFIEIYNEENGIKVYGFISDHIFVRDRRAHQFIFVNRRAVKNIVISHAIYNGYGGLLQKGKHPAFFVFVEIEPGKVDMNVHPAKLEVRFESPDEVHRCVEKAVHGVFYPEETTDYSISTHEPLFFETPFVKEDIAGFSTTTQIDFFREGITSLPPRYIHIGDSFIASVTDKGLMIIDQHAVHERVLYERFLRQGSVDRMQDSEPLLQPLRIELPVREYNIILNNRDILHEIGLEIEDFGGRDVIVKAMPRELHKADIKGILIDIASGIIEGVPDDRDALLRDISARLACHKSIRGRELLNDEEITSMLSELERCTEPDRCPHGRPTRVFFSIDDLRRLFKRR